MNMKNLLVASLAGGLVSLVLVNTPFVNLINLLACAGFWIGPITAVWLFGRLSGRPTLGEAVITGLLASLWHGLFGLLLSPLGLAGAGGMLTLLRPLVQAQDWPGVQMALTGLWGMLYNTIGVMIDAACGIAGGLMGGVLFGARRAAA